MRLLKVLAGCILLAVAGGCSHQQEIASRIKERPTALQLLGAADQQRIRDGVLKPGDSKDLAWYVYGDPMNRRIKTTAEGNSEIWSYTQPEFDPFVYPAVPVMRPVRTAHGHTVWVTDNYYLDANPRLYEAEVLRIEFKDGKVSSIESMVNQ